jgi:hypothetical protein
MQRYRFAHAPHLLLMNRITLWYATHFLHALAAQYVSVACTVALKDLK